MFRLVMENNNYIKDKLKYCKEKAKEYPVEKYSKDGKMTDEQMSGYYQGMGEWLTALLLQNDIQIGQVYYDRDCNWTWGAKDVKFFHLILSCDLNKNDNKYYYKTAYFMWLGDSFKGADTREFLEEEIKLMEYVGSLKDIINIKNGNSI